MLMIVTAHGRDLSRRFLRDERGQSVVESMLVISVLTIAIVGVGYLFAGGDSGFIQAMKNFAQGAGTVYSQGPE